MENSILMMLSFFLPVALPGFFAEKGPLPAQAQTEGPRAGQPPMGTPQGEGPGMGQSRTESRSGGAAPIQGLDAYALPGDAVSEADMPGIGNRIEQVLVRISESVVSAGTQADYRAIQTGLLAFQNWLKAQGCVADASSTYDIGKPDAYDENIFLAHPGQIPFDIVFRMAGGADQAYRLLVFVTTYELFNFGSLVKNNAKEEVYIPEKWPEDAPGYWESRS